MRKAVCGESAALSCSAARDEKIECAECGVLIAPDRADYAEGDGGMIPDRWFCHACQEADRMPDYDDDDRENCSYCDGEGWGIVGTDWDTDDAINGPYDGEIERCPNCGGSGKREDMTFW